MDSKGQGLSLSTIIIAIIVLIVLIVIILIFTGKIGVFSIGVKSCGDKGGSCDADLITCTNKAKAGTHFYLPNTNCNEKSTEQFCCVEIPKK